ncbi:MAG: energy transducer TonB [Crocinitomicaceae bacterium]|nr:energy transducer TonB [Crocinitomicaceae bacterium]
MKSILILLSIVSVVSVSCEGVREDSSEGVNQDYDNEEVIMEKIEFNENELLDFAEEDPSFPGGETEMNRFIQNNVEYPQQAIERGEEGIVYVQFVVNKKGEINNVSVIKGVSPALDSEAKRVIRKMPNWTPGKQNGAMVNVRFTIPISFKLS